MNNLKNKLLKNESIFFSGFATEYYQDQINKLFGISKEVLDSFYGYIVIYKGKENEVFYEKENILSSIPDINSDYMYISDPLFSFGYSIIITPGFEFSEYNNEFSGDNGKWLETCSNIFFITRELEHKKSNYLFDDFRDTKSRQTQINIITDNFPEKLKLIEDINYVDVSTIVNISELLITPLLEERIKIERNNRKIKIEKFIKFEFDVAYANFFYENIEEKILRETVNSLVISDIISNGIKKINLISKEFISDEVSNFISKCNLASANEKDFNLNKFKIQLKNKLKEYLA